MGQLAHAENLFFAQNLKRLLSQDAMTREPTCNNREKCRYTQRGKIPLNVQVVVKVKDTLQQNARKAIRKDEPNDRRNEPEDRELNGEDGGNARASGAERLQHDDLANAPIPCSRNSARKNNDARKSTEASEKLNDVADLQQHLSHSLYSSCDVDHRNRRIVLIQNATQLARRGGIAMEATVPGNR